MMQLLTIVCFAYLVGSIPTAQIVARWRKKIDLRRYGSGTVSGSMVYEHVGKLWVVPVGLFDIFKGALPAWMALQIGMGESGAVVAGLAALAGHNWPIFLHFMGGRGLSVFMGALLVIFPWGVPWLLFFLAIGYLVGDSAPWALGSIAAMPLLIAWMGGSAAVYWLVGGMIIITILKRLEANRRPLPEDRSQRIQVLLRRLMFDRDIRDHQEWIHRTPN